MNPNQFQFIVRKHVHDFLSFEKLGEIINSVAGFSDSQIKSTLEFALITVAIIATECKLDLDDLMESASNRIQKKQNGRKCNLDEALL
jgi:hypothetical protein